MAEHENRDKEVQDWRVEQQPSCLNWHLVVIGGRSSRATQQQKLINPESNEKVHGSEYIQHREPCRVGQRAETSGKDLRITGTETERRVRVNIEEFCLVLPPASKTRTPPDRQIEPLSQVHTSRCERIQQHVDDHSSTNDSIPTSFKVSKVASPEHHIEREKAVPAIIMQAKNDNCCIEELGHGHLDHDGAIERRNGDRLFHLSKLTKHHLQQTI